MNAVVFRAGITFAAGITCSAVGYAAREYALHVALSTFILSALFSVVAAAQEDV